jgi:hypothetical protein
VRQKAIPVLQRRPTSPEAGTVGGPFSTGLIGQFSIGTSGSRFGDLIPTGMTFPISGTIEIHAKAGTVSTVTVDKKEYKAAPVRVTLKDTHIKVHGCVGQSFLRSYATLTSATADTDDVVAYYGVTKAVAGRTSTTSAAGCTRAGATTGLAFSANGFDCKGPHRSGV